VSPLFGTNLPFVRLYQVEAGSLMPFRLSEHFPRCNETGTLRFGPSHTHFGTQRHHAPCNQVLLHNPAQLDAVSRPSPPMQCLGQCIPYLNSTKRKRHQWDSSCIRLRVRGIMQTHACPEKPLGTPGRSKIILKNFTASDPLASGYCC